MPRIFVVITCSLLIVPLRGSEPATVPMAAGLSLGEALARTLTDHPELAAYSAALRQAEAEVVQAGLRPNPNLFLEVENVLGGGPYRGADQAEITLGITQAIELWDRRRKRVAAADRGSRVADWDYHANRLRLAAVTATRFIAALGEQVELQLAEESVELATQYHRDMELRQARGIASPVDLGRAAFAREEARLEADLARQRLHQARQYLAALWGDPELRADHLAGDVFRPPALPDRPSLLAAVPGHPDVGRWAADQERLGAQLVFERANARPNVNVGAGYRWLNGPDEGAWVFLLGVPLPVANRNQGTQAAVAAALDQSRHQEEAARRRLRGDLDRLWEELARACSEARSVRERLLPLAEEVGRLTDQFREAGRVGALEVLAARRDLFAARRRELQALLVAHLARVELDARAGLLAPPSADSNSAATPPP